MENLKLSEALTSPDIDSYPRPGIAGTPLAEVFSIHINPTEECKLYGEIWVEDDKGIVDYLFNFDREEPKPISHDSSDNSLLICQSNRAILATSYFKVHFDLKDGDSGFLKETFSWYATTGEDHDKLLVETIVGEHGSATMSYIVHSLAIEAHIVPIFYKSKTVSSSVHVKGTIFARYKNMRYDFDESDGLLEYSRVQIFEQSALEMDDQEEFPLDRNVMAVPLYCPLEFEVDLRSCGSEAEGEGEGEGDCGEVFEKLEFTCREIENLFIEKAIKVPNGCMRLTVAGINYADMSFEEVELRKGNLGLNDRGGLNDGDST